MDDIGQGPNKWNGEEGNAEQDDVQDNGQKEISEPYSSAVHHPGVGVHLAVSNAHIHAEQTGTQCYHHEAGQKRVVHTGASSNYNL